MKYKRIDNFARLCFSRVHTWMIIGMCVVSLHILKDVGMRNEASPESVWSSIPSSVQSIHPNRTNICLHPSVRHPSLCRIRKARIFGICLLKTSKIVCSVHLGSSGHSSCGVATYLIPLHKGSGNRCWKF